MTPLTPESFNKMFPWRKYLKTGKKTLDDEYITDDDFNADISKKVLDKFHKYQAENGIKTSTDSIKS